MKRAVILLLIIEKDEVYMGACTKENVNPALVFQFLYALSKVLSSEIPVVMKLATIYKCCVCADIQGILHQD